jgi:hypothetical protein
MPPIAPFDFFLWDRPRCLIDIRSAVAFGKGSLEGAISMPADAYDTLQCLVELLNKTGIDQPVHFIDLNARIAEMLSREISSDYLEGGYKAFMAWRESAFETGPPLRLLGGFTGSGKTDLLRQLKKRGLQVIDLEELALHKGSVFGSRSPGSQPRHEHFQNKLLSVWLSLDPETPVLIEEKGPCLGRVGLPQALYQKMLKAPMIRLNVPFDQRLKVILQEYGNLDPDNFRADLRKLEARMGMSQNHKALHYHDTGQKKKCFELLLNYYDAAYERRRKMYWSGPITCEVPGRDDLISTIANIESCISGSRS